MQHKFERATFAFNLTLALLFCALLTVALIAGEHAATKGQLLPLNVTENTGGP
jgi:hypothetical protein